MPPLSKSDYNACITDDDQWPQLLARLPADFNASVFTCGAILRKRQIQFAAQFLRLIFAYACNLPLDVVAVWAAASGLASLSGKALDMRIRHARHWLSVLLTQVLAARTGLGRLPGLRLRLTDGTQVARPGATGTDWRLHLTFDLQRMRLDAVEVTDAHQSEGLLRSAPQPGDVVVGDRNYGKRAGVLTLVTAGAAVLVRIAWNTFPLRHADGRAFDLFAALRSLPYGACAAWDVEMVPIRKQDPVVTGRLVASRLPAVEAAAARERVEAAHRNNAKKNAAGQKAALLPATLEAAEYQILFTTIPASLATAGQIVALYGFRWQVELAIKRLKSILDLDHLTARHPDLCRAVLLAKLLLAVLTEDLCADAEAFSPSARGRRVAAPPAKYHAPVSLGVGTAARHHSSRYSLAAMAGVSGHQQRILL